MVKVTCNICGQILEKRGLKLHQNGNKCKAGLIASTVSPSASNKALQSGLQEQALHSEADNHTAEAQQQALHEADNKPLQSGLQEQALHSEVKVQPKVNPTQSWNPNGYGYVAPPPQPPVQPPQNNDTSEWDYIEPPQPIKKTKKKWGGIFRDDIEIEEVEAEPNAEEFKGLFRG